MQLTNNLFLHHLGFMRPVQFFKTMQTAADTAVAPPLPQWWGNFCLQELWLLLAKIPNYL
jgi:hypothetical protein